MSLKVPGFFSNGLYAIVKGQNGELKNVTVTDPLGRKITAQYGIVGNTAVIEMAAASGNAPFVVGAGQLLQ